MQPYPATPLNVVLQTLLRRFSLPSMRRKCWRFYII